jgi:hypothetical protein
VTSLDLAISAILALATAANLMLLFAVTRRLRMLETRTGPPGSESFALPGPGTHVAPFRVTDIAGVPADESDLAGGPYLVAFVMTGCDPCHAVLTSLRADRRFDPARTLIFVAGEPGTPHTQQVLDLADGLGRAAVIEHGGAVTSAFGNIDGFPALMAVRDRRVLSSGRSLDDVAPASELSSAG